MGQTGDGRALRRRYRFSAPQLGPGLWVGLWAALVAIVALVLAAWLLGDDEPAGYRVLFRLVGGAFVACGLIAWRRRPDSYSGLLMTVTGFGLFAEPVFAAFGWDTLADLGEDTWAIAIIWLLLTMLSGGRLVSRVDEALVGLFVFTFALEVVRVATGEDAFGAAEQVLVAFGCLGTAVVIGVRYKRANAPGRRALLPSVAGIGALLFFAVAQAAAPIWLRWLAVLSLLAIPAGFLVGQLRSRLARGGLADLFRRLPTMRSDELQPARPRGPRLAPRRPPPRPRRWPAGARRSCRGARWRRSTPTPRSSTTPRSTTTPS